MEYFIETRFGDPILSIDISKQFLVFGSALGQIGLFSSDTGEQFLLTELAEEGVKGVNINDEGHIFASIGDLYILAFKQNENNEWISERITFENRQHTSILCNNTQVLQYKMKICLLAIDNTSFLLSEKIEMRHRLFVFDCFTRWSEEFKGINFPKFSVPLSFTGDELLWMERDAEGTRVLKLLDFETLTAQVIKYFNKDFGTITCVCYAKEHIVFVHNLSCIKIMDTLTGNILRCACENDTEILAIFSYFTGTCDETDSSKVLKNLNLIISVDKSAKICIWQESDPIETIDLCCLEGIKVDSCDRFFGMGYPYKLIAYNVYIAVSTDIGIIVVKSDYLATLIC